MQQERASFWADIKSCEERLAQNPDSYLFARLSEAFLKLNLVDDALYSARQGVAKYPAYVAGRRALALACHAKGLVEESRQALESVAAAVPEDAEVQKLLGKILRDSGDREGAEKVYRVLLDFYPDDAESQEAVKTLGPPPFAAVEEPVETAAEPAVVPEVLPVQEDEIIDLDDADILCEEEPPVSTAAPHHDPLSTVTLAELYIKQGFVSKALEIYRSLVDEDPTNSSVLARIAELESPQEAGEAAPALAAVFTPDASALAAQEPAPLPPGVPARGEADAVVETLEGWLDSIRRIKTCR